jgi:hypothetical protein
MDNPLHISPDAQHGCPEHKVSLMSKLPLLEVSAQTIFGLFFQQ